MPEAQNSTYTRAQLLELVAEQEEHDRGIAEAKSAVSSLVRSRTQFRKQKVVALGVPLDVFDEALAEAKMSGGERQRRLEHKARILQFLDRPIPAYQPDFFETTEERQQGMVARLKVIDGMGYDAGLQGFDRRETNTYTPGTEEYVRFDNGWLHGDEAREKKEAGGDVPASQPAKRGRGRPRKATGNGADRHDEVVEDIARNDARDLGKEDGVNDDRMHADMFAEDHDDHDQYELGHAEGQRLRETGVTEGIFSETSQRLKSQPAA